MAAIISEDWNRWGWVPTERAHREFIVSHVNGELEARASLPGDARPPATFVSDNTLGARNPSVEQIGPSQTVYRLGVDYLPLDGTTTPKADDPLMTPVKRWVEFGQTNLRVMFDLDGNLIANAAGDPIEDYTEEFEMIFLCAERYETNWDVQRFMAYFDTVNSDRVSWPKMGALEPGQMRMAMYAPSGNWDENTKAVPCTYKFQIRRGKEIDKFKNLWDGFYTRIPNVGYAGWYFRKDKDGNQVQTREKIYDASDVSPSPVANAVPLDEDGVPCDSSLKIGRLLAEPAKAPSAKFWRVKPMMESIAYMDKKAVLLKYRTKPDMPFNVLF